MYSYSSDTLIILLIQQEETVWSDLQDLPSMISHESDWAVYTSLSVEKYFVCLLLTSQEILIRVIRVFSALSKTVCKKAVLLQRQYFKRQKKNSTAHWGTRALKVQCLGFSGTRHLTLSYCGHKKHEKCERSLSWGSVCFVRSGLLLKHDTAMRHTHYSCRGLILT